MTETRTNSTNGTPPIWMLIFNNLRLFSDFVMSWGASVEFVIVLLVRYRFTLEIAAFKVDCNAILR